MAPVDVSGPNTEEPVKVVHGGPGTHGAGGGGTGGGAVGQGGGSGDPSETSKSDIIGGKPRDSLSDHSDSPTARARSPSLLNRGKDKDKKNPSSPTASKFTGTNSETGDNKDKDKKTPSGPNEAFHDWEKQDMENLLNEIRGHLG